MIEAHEVQHAVLPAATLDERPSLALQNTLSSDHAVLRQTLRHSILETVARNVRATIITLSVVFAAVLAIFPLIGTTPVTGTLLLIGWGLTFDALPVSLQTWILKPAPDATEAATGVLLWVGLLGGLAALALALAAGVGGGVLWLTVPVAAGALVYRWRKSAAGRV